MTPDFVAVGHDSMMASLTSVSNKAMFVEEEQLTIYSHPLSAGSAIELTDVVYDEVPELQWSPNRVFA